MIRNGALQTEDRGLEQLSAPDVVSVYRQSLQRRGFIPDAAQWRAVERLQRLFVEGRRIAYRRRAGGIIWFDFQALCGGPRSYADYVDLARRFHTVILSGVPKLSAKNADAAWRFTWLVDVFYDDRVKLVVSAEAQPEELYSEGTNSADFARAASRLHEMQSAEYLQTERRREHG